MTWLFQHFYWSYITKKAWNFFIPIIGFQKLLRRFRLIRIIKIKTILAVGHLFHSLLLRYACNLVFDRLVSFTTEIRKITLTDETLSILIKGAFLIAVSIRFSDITVIIVITETITLLAAFNNVHFTFIKSLRSLIVRTRNSDLRLRR